MTKNNFEQKMGEGEIFEEIYQNWLECFVYMLQSFKVGYTKKVAHHLFHNFDMSNSKMFWKENNPEYKDYDKSQLIKSFKAECRYILDRYSYDRIFRTHWLFLQSFKEELNYIKYPTLYK